MTWWMILLIAWPTLSILLGPIIGRLLAQSAELRPAEGSVTVQRNPISPGP